MLKNLSKYINFSIGDTIDYDKNYTLLTCNIEIAYAVNDYLFNKYVIPYPSSFNRTDLFTTLHNSYGKYELWATNHCCLRTPKGYFVDYFVNLKTFLYLADYLLIKQGN